MLIQWRASSHRVVPMSSPSSGRDCLRLSKGRPPVGRVARGFLPFPNLVLNHFRCGTKSLSSQAT